MPKPTSLKPLAVRVAALSDESMLRRGELVRMANSSGATSSDSDDGFPPGVTCDCGNCISGITIPDGTECCTSHTQFSLVNPWLECEDTDLTLDYIGTDEWLTEPFDGPDCDGNQNEYRWHLTIDVDGRSYLTLDLETDNGCDPVCIIYGRDGFDCQCDNAFSLLKPYGTWMGVDRDQLSCHACLKPVIQLATCSGQPVPSRYTLTLTDPGLGVDPLDRFHPDGTFEIVFAQDYFCQAGCLGALTNVWVASYQDPVDSGETITVIARCEGANRINVLFVACGSGPDDGFNYYSFVSSSFDFNVGGELPMSSYCSEPTVPDLSAVISLTPIDPQSQPTSSGVCDETCTPPAAPTNPTGYCCFEGNCYDYWDATLCADFGGLWNAGGDCGESTCENSFACCVAGTCVDTTEYNCLLLGGTVAIGACSDGVCELGSCCRADTGTCEVVPEAECQAPDYFAGPDTDCTSDPCPVGACCTMADDGHTCACEEDLTYILCQDDGGAPPHEKQWAPGLTCAEAEADLGVCGEDAGNDCGWGF